MNAIKTKEMLVSSTLTARIRYEAKEFMKSGYSFEAVSNTSAFNSDMLNFYMKEYNYKRTKLRRGVYLYEPQRIQWPEDAVEIATLDYDRHGAFEMEAVPPTTCKAMSTTEAE